ncbi:ABC transporter ATP-binding protein [Paraglaciecola sp.]|uniref:ABC transporter ATP-binding protein n=1 Tax=Paraglaciecola sp. TaxID=1920173 RepID=UPI0030F3CEF8
MELAINVSDLNFSWNKNSSFCLSIVDWQVSCGQKVFLYGQSGSGKSTLLNLLSGVITGYSGQLKVLDHDLQALSGAKRDCFRAQHIGMIFQQFNLLPYLSGLQNIQLAQYFAPQQKTKNNELLGQLTDKLQLSKELLKQSACTMSVGQQQRIAVARALINQPQLIIADEPTSALDSELRDHFIELLLSTASESTVIFVSHDKSLAAHFDVQYDLTGLQQTTNMEPAQHDVV